MCCQLIVVVSEWVTLHLWQGMQMCFEGPSKRVLMIFIVNASMSDVVKFSDDFVPDFFSSWLWNKWSSCGKKKNHIRLVFLNVASLQI